MRAALLELLAPSVCPVCDRARPAGEPLLCPAAACAPDPLLWLGGVRTAFAYEGAGLELVRRFKFEGRRDALDVICALLFARIERLPFDVIVPVPRHRKRVRSLGADPVYELARALARATRRPLMAGVLRRSRPTLPQTGLSVGSRRRNVAGSFAASRALPDRVLLLDDVATTGATLAQAARTLRASGATRLLQVAAAGTPALSAPRRNAI